MDTSGLSKVHALLLAVHLSVSAEVDALPALQTKFPNILTLDVLLRIILTFVPETTAPAQYTPVVQSLVDGVVPKPLSEINVDTSAIKGLSVTEAKKRVRRLRILPLRYPELRDNNPPAGSLTEFLIHRAHRIDSECGIQPYILELLEPFLSASSAVRTFAVSTVLPLLRFNYEYHPNKDEILSLRVVESLDSGSAVNLLLSKAERKQDGGNAARDLRGLVGPWMHGHALSKRRKLVQENGSKSSNGDNTCGWQDVNEWLLSLSLRDFELLVEAVEEWDGPEDVDLGGYEETEDQPTDETQDRLRQRYGQAVLAAIYATSPTSVDDVLNGSCRILSKVAKLFGLRIYSPTRSHDTEDLSSVPTKIPSFHDTLRGLLFHSELLEPSNVFTAPSPETIAFMDIILLTIRILNSLGRSIYPRDVAELCLFADDDVQLFELRAVLESMTSKPPKNWRQARQHLSWLRDWTGVLRSGANTQEGMKGLFWRIPSDVFEREVLKTMLTAKQYSLAVELYANPVGTPPLPRDQLETAVTEVIFVSYDNATNGNKTRGGIKRASVMLECFSPHFPQSTSFRQIKSLISATHALSFYSLTLHHGVPFQPVSIRVHHDPLSLIEKVLEQNPKAYSQLDNLLVIARHLVAAGLPCLPKEYESKGQSITQDQLALISERRIISYAVSSALQADDFDTAYSYILTRLNPPSLITTPPATDSSALDDHISWRAAFNAGKHRPTQPDQPNRSLQSQISHLSKRMELLSLALILTPSPENLPEILAVWRRSDEEMTVLQTRESEEAEKWDTYGDQSALASSASNNVAVPGGFGPSDRELDALETAEKRARRSNAERLRRKGAYEEAPVGLFDAARGAAKALSKTAFSQRGGPLDAQSQPTSKPGAGVPGSESGSIISRSSFDAGGDESGSAEGRVRKRDMVSNMVTGGLVSGIGWVLGAEPVNQNAGKQGGEQ